KWIKVALQGTKANRSAIGATVTIEAGGVRQTLPLLGQSSFLSQNERRLHFGLGSAAKVDKVIVRWPAGAPETFPGGPAGATLHWTQGAGPPCPCSPPFSPSPSSNLQRTRCRNRRPPPRVPATCPTPPASGPKLSPRTPNTSLP